MKDLDRLGRDLEKVVIIDNSPASYAFHPENAVSFFALKNLFETFLQFLGSSQNMV